MFPVMNFPNTKLFPLAKSSKERDSEWNVQLLLSHKRFHKCKAKSLTSDTDDSVCYELKICYRKAAVIATIYKLPS